MLWKYGHRIRMRSKYAHKPVQHQTQNNKVEESRPTTLSETERRDIFIKRNVSLAQVNEGIQWAPVGIDNTTILQKKIQVS